MNKFLLIFTFVIFSFSLISAQGFVPPSTNSFTYYTGNLTNLSELQDVNIPTPSDGNFLRYSSATSKWIVYPFALSDFWDYDYADLINEPTALSDFTDDILWTSGFNATGDTRYLLLSNWNVTNSSYLTSETNWNGNYSTYLTLFNWNKTYADTLYSTIDEPLWTANYSTFLLNNESITNTFLNYYTKTESDAMNTSINNWVSSLSLSDFTNNLNIGNWTADKGSYYTSAQTDTEILNANTSVVNWADSKFVTNSGGDSLSGQYDFNGGWTSNGLSIINGNIYAQSVYAYNYSGLNVYTLATNGSLIPTMDNQFDLGNSTLKWRNINLGGNISAGTTLFVNQGTGRVGIGITSPVTALQVEGTATFDVTRLMSNAFLPGSSKLYLWTDTTGNYIGNTGASTLFGGNYPVIFNAGNVGIGTTAPGATLDVQKSSATALRIGDASSYPALFNFNTVTGDFSTFSRIKSYSSTNMIFSPGGADTMTLQPGGNVGIGTTTPGAKLEVNGGNILINRTGDGQISYSVTGDSYITYSNAFRLYNGGERFILSSAGALTLGTSSTVGSGSFYAGSGYFSGNVGIGTTGPERKLHVLSTAFDDGITVESSEAGSSFGPRLRLWRNSASPAVDDLIGLIQFDAEDSLGNREDYAAIGAKLLNVTDGAEAAELQFYTSKAGVNTQQMVITNQGNVGIGTTSPSTELHVGGTTPLITVKDNAQSYYTTYGDYEVKSSGTNLYLNSGVADPDISIGYNDLIRAYGSLGKVSINGNVGIGTASPANKLNVIGAVNATTGFIVGANTGLTQNFQMLNATSLSCWMNYTGGILTTSNC